MVILYPDLGHIETMVWTFAFYLYLLSHHSDTFSSISEYQTLKVLCLILSLLWQHSPSVKWNNYHFWICIYADIVGGWMGQESSKNVLR